MITVRVPATSANCSIGFDTLGLAFDWRSTITFEKSDAFLITGCPQEYAKEDNLVYTSFVKACSSANVAVPPVHIHIDSDLPFARGLGSSSQCVIAGLLGANLLCELNYTDEQILSLAIEIEGHPDNVAPALYGGLNLCVGDEQGFRHVLWKSKGWKALLVIPPYEVSTPMARKALPACISLHDAAMQAGYAMLFEQAWQSQDEELLYFACHDAIHEPCRSTLIAHYPAMKAIAGELALPFWISGSGPTMAFVSQSADRLSSLYERLQKEYPELLIRLADISEHGAEAYYG